MKFYENDNIELKRLINDKLEIAIVAFLNSMDGIIYIGVDNDGTIVGVANPDKSLREIADIISDKILPSALEYIKASVVIVENKQIIKIEVKKSNEPIHYLETKGLSPKGVYYRLGTSNRMMSIEEIKNRYIKSLNVVKPSIVELEAHYQDLTFNILKGYFRKYKVHFDGETFEKTYRLRNKEGKYNRLSELLADENDVDIKVARFQGTDKSILVGVDDYESTSLIFIVENVLGRLDAENFTSVIMTGSRRIEKRLLDSKALREAFLNAINHNDWTQKTPPAIYLFADRVEIISHGGLPDGQTQIDFFRGVSVPRNKELMDIMRHFDFAEATGHGVPDIINAYGKSVFMFSPHYINVMLPYDQEVISSKLTKNDGINDGINEEIKEEIKEGLKLNEFEIIILGKIRDNPKITIKNMIKMTNMAKNKIERAIQKLASTGVIERSGSRKTGCWQINEHLNDGINDGINEEIKEEIKLTKFEVILFYEIRKNPKITTTQMMIITNRSRPSVERALRRLIEVEAIERIGSRKSGYWKIK